MTVQLSALRIDLEADSSSYTSAMAAKVQADNAAVASSQRLSSEIDRANKLLASNAANEAAWAKISTPTTQSRAQQFGTNAFQQAATTQQQSANDNDPTGLQKGMAAFMQESANGVDVAVRWGRALAATGVIAAAAGTGYLALTGQLGVLSDASKAAGDKMSSLVTWFSNIDGQTLAAGAAVGVLGAALVLYKSEADEAGQASTGMTTNAGNLGVSLLATTGIIGGITEAFRAYSKIMSEVVALGDRASDSRLGVGMLQALETAASQARVPLETLNSGLDEFTKVSKQSADEAKSFYRALSNVDPALSAAFKGAPTQIDRLKIFSDGLAQAKDEAARYNLALQGLGSDNDRLISIFSNGAAGINGYVQKLHELSGVMDESYIKKVQDSQASFDAFTTSLKQKFVIAVVDASKAVSDFGTALASGSETGASALSAKLKDMSGGVTTFAQAIRDVSYDWMLLSQASQSGVSLGDRISLLRQVIGLNLSDVEQATRDAYVAGGKVAAAAQDGAAAAPPRVHPLDQALRNIPAPAPVFQPRPSLSDDKDKDTHDAWDRAVTSIEKKTLAQKADTIAVGASSGAAAELKSEFQLLEAAKTADKGITDAQIQSYTALRGSMDSHQALVASGIKLENDDADAFGRVTQAIKAATDANALAQANSKITFDRQTALFTQDDLQVAQALKNIYGGDWQSHMNDAIAGQIKFNATLKDINDNVITAGMNNLTSALSDIVMGTQTASAAFKNLGLQVIKSIEEMVIKIAIIKPLASSLTSALGGLVPGFSGGSSPGQGTGNGLTDMANNGTGLYTGPAWQPGFTVPGVGSVSAKGNVFQNGNVIHPYALGGLVSDILVKPTLFPMANGAGLAGEAGPEAIMPLRRGADGRLGVAAAMGGGGNGQAGGTTVLSPSFTIQYAGSAPSDPSAQAAHAAEMNRQFEGMMNTWAIKQQRVGGLLRPN